MPTLTNLLGTLYSGAQGIQGAQGSQGIQGLPKTNVGLTANIKTSAYTLTTGDVGEYIGISTGGITISSNTFSVGDYFTIYNSSGIAQTITQGAGTSLYVAGTASTGNVSMAGTSIVTIICVSSNTFVIAGANSSQPDGSENNPFLSPLQAQSIGVSDGNYYFKSGSMLTAQLLEYKNNYYESKPWVCVFRAPYRSTATTNKIDLNITMGGLLVQRDALDIRAAVYWSTPITYNTIGGSGNNTANSGYTYRRVMLGGGGSHGLYNTGQQACNWGDAVGSVGAGYNGTCGSFPNDLVQGTGQNGNPFHSNESGTWSHWVYWS